MSSPTSTNRPLSETAHDIFVACGLGLLVLALILLTHPFANVPMNDDFSYARTAEALAQTGHIMYNGWGSPLLWPQAAYGAVVIRCFGFSYSILAMTGAFMGTVATGLFYLLARRCGCRPVYAILATCALTLNPMFLCTAPTFMTDVPSLALFLVTLLVLVSAIGRDADGRASVEPRRLILSSLLAVFAGSNRQLIWICDLAALAVLFALIPKQRKLIGIVIGVVLDCAIAMNYWYDSQPYTVSPNPGEGIRRLRLVPGAVAVSILRYLDIAGILLLPLALTALPRLRTIGVRPRTIAIVACVWMAAIVLPYHNPFKMPSFGVFPYAEYFTSQGALIGGPPGYSRRPVVFPAAFSAVLTVAGAVGLSIFSLYIWHAARDFRSALRNRNAASGPLDDALAPDDRQRAIQLVMLAAFLVQFAASFFWFCANYLYDRYLLLFVPGFLIFLGLQASRNRVPRLTVRLASIATAIIAVIGFTFAQDYTGYGHARADLFHALRLSGVSPKAINGGFELDADAQVCLAGYVNSPQVVKPAGAFNPKLKAPHISFLGEEFPALDPYFRITTDSVILPSEDAYPTPVLTTTYRSLLPPFERKMYVYRVKR